MSKWKKAPIMEIKTNVDRRQAQNSYIRVEEMIRNGISRTRAYRLMRENCCYLIADPMEPKPYRVMSRLVLHRLRVAHVTQGRKRGNPSFRDREAQRERAKRRWERKNE